MRQLETKENELQPRLATVHQDSAKTPRARFRGHDTRLGAPRVVEVHVPGSSSAGRYRAVSGHGMGLGLGT